MEVLARPCVEALDDDGAVETVAAIREGGTTEPAVVAMLHSMLRLVVRGIDRWMKPGASLRLKVLPVPDFRSIRNR